MGKSSIIEHSNYLRLNNVDLFIFLNKIINNN